MDSSPLPVMEFEGVQKKDILIFITKMEKADILLMEFDEGLYNRIV